MSVGNAHPTRSLTITLDVLISIRDEIKSLRGDIDSVRDKIRQLRADTNRRFEEMHKRFEHIESDIAEMKSDMKAIVARFDRDYLLLASETENIKQRLSVCARKLNLYPSGQETVQLLP